MFLFLFLQINLNLSKKSIFSFPILGNGIKHRSKDLINVYIGRIGIPNNISTYEPLYKSTILCSSEERQRKTKPFPHYMIGRKPEFTGISFQYGFNTDKTEFCHETFRKTQITFLNRAIENNIQYEFLIDKYAIWVPIGVMGSSHTETSSNDDQYTINMKKAIFTHFDVTITQDKGKVLNCQIIPSKPLTIVGNKKIRYTFTYALKDIQNPNANMNTKNDSQLLSNEQFHFQSNILITIVECVALSMFVFSNVTKMYQIDKKTGEKYFVWYPLHGDIFRNPAFEKVFCIIIGIVCHLSFAMVLCIFYFIVFSSKEPSSHLNTITTTTFLSTFLSILKYTEFVQGFVTTCFCNTFLVENSLKITTSGYIFEYIMLFLIFLPLNASKKYVGSSYICRIQFASFIHFFIHHGIISFISSIIGYIISNKYDILGTAPCETMPFPKINRKPPLLLKFPFSFFFYGFSIAFSILDQYTNLLLSFWNENSYHLSIASLFYFVFIVILISSLLSLYVTSSRVESKSPHWQWNSLFSPLSVCLILFFYSNKLIKKLHIETNSLEHLLFTTYSFFISLIISMLCSASSYISSLFFLRYAFSTRKDN